METKYSVIPQKSPLKLDIMVGDNFVGQVTFPCQVGVEYSFDELTAFVRMKKSSLCGKAIEVIPTAQRVFR